jgi:small neutral amino acid transporter SnatA (MarC family)
VTSGVATRLGTWAVLAVVVAGLTRAFVTLPEQCGDPTAATVEHAASETVAWFERNQQPDGRWLYRFDADAGRDLGGYNWVRHAGVLLSLEQAATHGLPRAEPVATAGHAAIRDLLVPVDGDLLAVEEVGRLTTGGTGLLVAALAERRARTGDTSGDDTLRALGGYLRRQVEARGSVLEAADPRSGVSEPGSYSPFSTGEALFALAALERELPGEGWGEVARRIAGYVATDRARLEGYVPDTSDHWSAYGLAEVVGWPGGVHLDDAELAFSRKQLGILSIQVRWESQRTNSGVDRWTRGRTALGAGVGTLGEALGSWAAVAGGEPALADQVAWIDERLRCVGGVLSDRQISAEDARRFPVPGATQGAFLQFGITQMDDQQHALSALLFAAERMRVVDPPLRRAPVPETAAIVVVSVLVASNPLRFSARGVTGRRRVRVTAAGAAGGALVLALVAAAGGPLLRWLHVSAATALVAAGLVIAVAGLVAAAWPTLRREPALAGWRSAAVPVAVPLTVRPELVLLAVAVGAGGQGWPFATGLAVAVAGSAAAAAWQPAEASPAATVRAWLVRLVGAATVAAGVALVVDGVYAV